MNVTRAQVLAYRYLAHGLADGVAPSGALLDLGVQDTSGSAVQALAARGLPASRLATVWSFRGAPHLHRSADLTALSVALWPLSEADALTRLAGLGTTLRKTGGSGLAAVTATAEAVRSVVRGPTTKGDLSARVSKKLDTLYCFWCRGCQATHVHDQLLRLAALHGGVRNEGAAPVTFVPIPGWPGVPASAAGTERLVSAYLTLHGPATPTDAGGFLGTTGAAVKPVWPGGLAEVSVDGRTAWLPPSSVAALKDAPRPQGVRLLPPSDPYLQMRDRELLVPDAARRKAVWTVLAWPGVVVVDGEVAGTWRAKQAGRGRLVFTVTAFGPVPPKALDAEAARVAAVRGAAAYEVA
jgi:hypothetical protein